MAYIKFIEADVLNYLTNCVKAGDREVISLFFKETNKELCDHLKDFFRGQECFRDSKFFLPDFQLDPNPRGAAEILNMKSVHEKMHILPAEAADKRLWIGLCIVHCWDYVRKRWDITPGNKAQSKILSHFLYGDGGRKSDTRNACARLWWISELTYDKTRKGDEYFLLKFVLSDTDYIINLLERTFSNNRQSVCEFIQAVSKAREEGYRIGREEIRKLCVHLNLLGGVYMLDAMSAGSVYNKIYACAKEFGK